MERLELDNPVITAPLAGVGDKPFRKLISCLGPSLIFTEMISTEALTRNNGKTLKMIDFSDEPYNLAVQLFGADPDKFSAAIEMIQSEYNPFVIDINLGCPIKKIVKSGAGAALLRSLDKIDKILNAASKLCKTRLTIKIRSGWASNSINYLETGKLAEYYGLSAIILHPRTATQLYAGKADWSHIKNLKNSVNIPVIGNGDIITFADYEEKKGYCDYIMLGRGLLYNPFLIKDILAGRPNALGAAADESLKKIMNKHLQLSIEEYGDYNGSKRFRKHFAWYIKNRRNAKLYKARGFNAVSGAEFVELIDEIFA